jgi:hypothetical protein
MKKTKATNWMMHVDGQPGRVIHPIPFTGLADFFCPNISDEELKGMVDVHGNVRFSKIFEWMLLTFEGESFYEFLSARMRNFMLHRAEIFRNWQCREGIDTQPMSTGSGNAKLRAEHPSWTRDMGKLFG